MRATQFLLTLGTGCSTRGGVSRGNVHALRIAMRTEAELNRIAYEIRGCGLRVHRKLGPGCFESAYSPCFAYELTKSKLEFRSEVPLTLCYEGIVVPDAYVSDYIIEGCVVGELKAV